MLSAILVVYLPVMMIGSDGGVITVVGAVG